MGREFGLGMIAMGILVIFAFLTHACVEDRRNQAANSACSQVASPADAERYFECMRVNRVPQR